MPGTDHPPSTTSPPCAARRALTHLVWIAALAALIALAGAAPGGARLASAAEAHAEAPPSIDAGGVALARIATLALAVAPPTIPTVVATPTTTEPAAPPAPPRTDHGDPHSSATWDRLSHCESSGNWAANTGNGYYGGIQFSLSSWRAVGGTGRPDQASREVQIAMGQRLWNQGGWGHWPSCSRQLGYR